MSHTHFFGIFLDLKIFFYVLLFFTSHFYLHHKMIIKVSNVIDASIVWKNIIYFSNTYFCIFNMYYSNILSFKFLNNWLQKYRQYIFYIRTQYSMCRPWLYLFSPNLLLLFNVYNVFNVPSIRRNFPHDESFNEMLPQNENVKMTQEEKGKEKSSFLINSRITIVM